MEEIIVFAGIALFAIVGIWSLVTRVRLVKLFVERLLGRK
jgi:hypothetical protein